MDITMNELLQATIDEGGSDLHIRAYMPPELRVHGELLPLADEALSEEDTYRLCKEVSTEKQMEEVERNGGADFALAHPDGTRFRVSVFKERKRYGMVLRQIPSKLLTMEQLGLPPVVKELLFSPQGCTALTTSTQSARCLRRTTSTRTSYRPKISSSVCPRCMFRTVSSCVRTTASIQPRRMTMLSCIRGTSPQAWTAGAISSD